MTPVSERQINIGHVGVAHFGAYRRERLQEAGGFKLVACYDRNLEALREVAQRENAFAAESFEAMLTHPDIEAVVISTGVDTHAPLAVAAMRAGKHVFIEKPLCATPQEISELREVQKQTGRVVGVGHSNNLTDPVAALVMQTIESGDLGTVVCYECNSSHSGGLEIQPGDWRGIKDRNPGGMLMQCGVHSLHRINYMFGTIDSVSCMMRYDAHPGTETADAANVLIRHTSGLLGTLNCYHVTAYRHDLRIFGTRGNLEIETHDMQAWYQKRERNLPEKRVPVEVPPPDSHAPYSNVANWRRAILGSGQPCPSLEDGIAAVAPVFAAQLAHDERREVSLMPYHSD